jgi:hypothetical protein
VKWKFAEETNTVQYDSVMAQTISHAWVDYPALHGLYLWRHVLYSIQIQIQKFEIQI